MSLEDLTEVTVRNLISKQDSEIVHQMEHLNSEKEKVSKSIAVFTDLLRDFVKNLENTMMSELEQVIAAQRDELQTASDRLKRFSGKKFEAVKILLST